MVISFRKAIAITALSAMLPQSAFSSDLTKEDVEGWAKSIAAEQGEYVGNPLEGAPDKDKDIQEDKLTAVPQRKVFDGRRTLIFISRSMSDAELKSILEDNSDDKKVQLVVRGFPEGANTVEAIAYLQKLVMDSHSKAGVIIDPPAFKRHHITAVPVTVLEENETALLTVRGNASAQYVADAYDKGDRGDLGAIGPTVDIAERDLVDVMQERAHQVDFEKLKKSAKDRFWANQKYYELEKTAETQTREIDPTVIVGADILDQKGNVIAAKGTKINPLDVRPFTQRLVVFDGRDNDQVQFAKREYQQYSSKQRVTLIISSLNTENGWESFQQLQSQVDAPLFVLTPEVISTFEIERVPSVIYADDRKFIVVETKTEELLK